MRPARVLLLAGLLVFLTAAGRPQPPVYPQILLGTPLRFPRDHGAHPDFRTEWWYVTGWLDTGQGPPLGFQLTFFRSRPATDQRNPSAFAPRQILFAHAALSDPSVGHLLHDQRAARAGFGLAQTSTSDMDVVIDDWSLKRDGGDHIHARVGGKTFALDLVFAPTQPILLQGEGGYSRKGRIPGAASAYYLSLIHI